jgi:shikimate kinase
MITALIGHRGVGKTALLKRPEILFSRREDVILSDLDFEIEKRAGRSIASNNLVMSAYGTKRTSSRRRAMSAFGGKADIAFDRCNVCF